MAGIYEIRTRNVVQSDQSIQRHVESFCDAVEGVSRLYDVYSAARWWLWRFCSRYEYPLTRINDVRGWDLVDPYELGQRYVISLRNLIKRITGLHDVEESFIGWDRPFGDFQQLPWVDQAGIGDVVNGEDGFYSGVEFLCDLVEGVAWLDDVCHQLSLL